MNNERTIVLENVSSQAVGLKDTQTRTYRLAPGAKIRISKISLQDILDYPASKIIFAEGLVKISNIDAESLYNMGLTEDEINSFTKELIAAVVISKDLDEKNEEVKEVIEPKKTTSATKKTTAKKTTTKKTSTSKTK